MTTQVRVRYAQDAAFGRALRDRVERYFADSPYPRVADGPLQRNVAGICILWWVAYAWLVFGPGSIWSVATALLALVLLSPAVIIAGHSISHGLLGDTRPVRWLGTATTIILGMDPNWWHHKHNHLHHTYTNIYGLDDDIHQSGWLRLSVREPWRPFHRLQWLYAWFLYPLTWLAMILVGDVRFLISGRMSGRRLGERSLRTVFRWFASKALAASALIGIPVLIHPTETVLILFLVWAAGIGLVFSILFQTNHCVGTNDYPQPHGESGVVPVDWRIAQIEGAAEVAANNRLFTWLFGGLNLHIAHHLFPSVSPTHYRALGDIVRTLCDEHGVRYRRFPTLRSAIGEHVRFLQAMGRPEFESIANRPLTVSTDDKARSLASA